LKLVREQGVSAAQASKDATQVALIKWHVLNAVVENLAYVPALAKG
jgi:hypothetical protein